MTKILFICHGNICRSPMAEFVMKDLVRKAGLEESFYIESAATSREELGNPVYPPARRKLAEHGISCQGKQPGSSPGRTTSPSICWWVWTGPICGIWSASAAATPRASSTCCWITPLAPAKWPTPGTPGTSTLPGGMCWKAAKGCWPSWPRNTGFFT